MTIDEYVKLVLFAKSDVYASCKDNIELPKVLEADEYLMLNTLFNIHSRWPGFRIGQLDID